MIFRQDFASMGDKCNPFRLEWLQQDEIPNLGSQIWFGFSFVSFRIKVQMVLYFNILPIKNQFNRRGLSKQEGQCGEKLVFSPQRRIFCPFFSGDQK